MKGGTDSSNLLERDSPESGIGSFRQRHHQEILSSAAEGSIAVVDQFCAGGNCYKTRATSNLKPMRISTAEQGRREGGGD